MAANDIIGEASGIAPDEALALDRLIFEIRSFEERAYDLSIVVTVAAMVPRSLAAAEALAVQGVSAEVVDVRSRVPLPAADGLEDATIPTVDRVVSTIAGGMG